LSTSVGYNLKYFIYFYIKFVTVCAGLANYFNLNVALIRLFIAAFPSAWIIYLLLAFMLKNKPPTLAQSTTHFSQTLEELEEQLQRIEQNVRHLENYVISDEFELRRKRWE
jgi:phage shock protein C